MTEQALSSSYEVIKKEIVRVLLDGHEKARQAVERERLRAYWEVGRILDSHLRGVHGDSGYGTRLMSQLGEDLRMDPRRLYNMVEVFRAFEKLNSNSILTFTHFLHLSRVKEAAERTALAAQCERERWSVRELQAALGEKAGALVEGAAGSGSSESPGGKQGAGSQNSGRGATAPVPRKGRLSTYRLLENALGDGKEVKLDLGFRIRLALQRAGALGIEAGKAVECVEDPNGQLVFNGCRY